MSRPIVVLLTDFGTRDHYVAAMKGAVLSVAPDATLVDLTHEVEPHDVAGATLELLAAYQVFPDGTTFLTVVDPGVGSTRKGLAASAGPFRFTGPDNGLLAPIIDAAEDRVVVELTSVRHRRPRVSRTFEGRDRFGPAAGWLARGVDLRELGPPVATWAPLVLERPTVAADAIIGRVVRADHFGNLVTNIDRQAVDRLAQGAGVVVVIEDRNIGAPVETYADGSLEHPSALFGSTDCLEIALNGKSATKSLGLARGARVTVVRA